MSQEAKALEFVRPGITFSELRGQLDDRGIDAWDRSDRHSQSATRWRRLAGPLAWFAALLATLSGLSLLAEDPLWTQVAALATALIAATNAALNPSETARHHRAASLAYDRLRLKMEDVALFEVDESGKRVPTKQVRAIRERLNKFDEEMHAIDENSPALARPDYGARRWVLFAVIPGLVVVLAVLWMVGVVHVELPSF